MSAVQITKIAKMVHSVLNARILDGWMGELMEDDSIVGNIIFCMVCLVLNSSLPNYIFTINIPWWVDIESLGECSSTVVDAKNR